MATERVQKTILTALIVAGVFFYASVAFSATIYEDNFSSYSIGNLPAPWDDLTGRQWEVSTASGYAGNGIQEPQSGATSQPIATVQGNNTPTGNISFKIKRIEGSYLASMSLLLRDYVGATNKGGVSIGTSSYSGVSALSIECDEAADNRAYINGTSQMVTGDDAGLTFTDNEWHTITYEWDSTLGQHRAQYDDMDISEWCTPTTAGYITGTIDGIYFVGSNTLNRTFYLDSITSGIFAGGTGEGEFTTYIVSPAEDEIADPSLTNEPFDFIAFVNVSSIGFPDETFYFQWILTAPNTTSTPFISKISQSTFTVDDFYAFYASQVFNLWEFEAKNITYEVRARAVSTSGIVSNWSATTTFHTIVGEVIGQPEDCKGWNCLTNLMATLFIPSSEYWVQEQWDTLVNSIQSKVPFSYFYDLGAILASTTATTTAGLSGTFEIPIVDEFGATGTTPWSLEILPQNGQFFDAWDTNMRPLLIFIIQGLTIAYFYMRLRDFMNTL